MWLMNIASSFFFLFSLSSLSFIYSFLPFPISPFLSFSILPASLAAGVYNLSQPRKKNNRL